MRHAQRLPRLGQDDALNGLTPSNMAQQRQHQEQPDPRTNHGAKIPPHLSVRPLTNVTNASKNHPIEASFSFICITYDFLMKPLILPSLIGGIVLFVWQFLSYAGMNLHGNAQTYTPLQDDILAHLAELNLEEGMYALGSPSPEERADYNGPLGAAYVDQHAGKPHGVLNYQHSLDLSMGSNLFRSFCINLLTALAMLWLLGQMSLTLQARLLASLAIGLVGFMLFPYSNFIWYKNPDIWAHLLDAVVPFAFLGWLSHRTSKSS